jgi:uncharacterized membrane protein YeaQ/YmgE (transglycosylase-associated protein family)
MFDRISNSFSLARSSWDVLRRDKRFVLFPMISGIGCLLVTISFAIPIAIVAMQGGINVQADNRPPWWTYLVAFAFYFCNYFVIVFCNSALVSCALMRFAGEEPTVRDGFSAAAARMPQILAWALVSATVGVLLKMIENAHEKAGQFISMILGTAWTVITFFVVPILVVEKVGPFEAVGRSVSLLKRTWGEALVGHWGLGFFTFLLALPGLLIFGLAILLMSVSPPAGAGVLVLAILYLMMCGAVSSALNTVFLAAMYQYASFKTVPVGFDRHVIEGAFQPRRSTGFMS